MVLSRKVIKNVCFALVFFAFILMVIGCSPRQTPSEDTSETPAASDANDKLSSNAATNAADDSKRLSINEQVLLEQNGLMITAKEIDNDSIWGVGIKLLIENNSDKNLGVTSNALIVNNYMISDLFSSSIAAGKKSNEMMYISSSGLSASGINKIGQIEVYFHVYDSDTYDTILDSDVITIQTSEYAAMDIKAMDDGKELYNQDGIKIVGKYVDEESFWGTAILLYIENSSGKNVGINCDNMSINGFMVTPFFTSTIYAGKMALDDITIMSSDLVENGIKSVDTIELSFHIYDSNTYETIIDTAPITFTTK